MARLHSRLAFAAIVYVMTIAETRGSERPGVDLVARPEILSSWRRCELAGVPKTRDLNSSLQHDVEARSALLRAADPVIEAFLRHLAGLSFSVLLIDSEARLVKVGYAERRIGMLMDQTGAAVGQLLSEENSGTNSLATAFELRKGIAVHGDEHYLEAFRGYSCYGRPIFNRATGRVEGVLDITCGSEEHSALLKPFLCKAAEEIEDRLIESGRSAQARLLAAFQDATVGRAGRSVLVLGEGVHLESPSVSTMLDADDRMMISALAAELASGKSRSQSVRLTRGSEVALHLTSITRGGMGVLCVIEPAAATPLMSAPASIATPPGPCIEPFMTRRRAPDLATLHAAQARVAVSGEPGTGRTSVLRMLAGNADVCVLDASDLTPPEEQNWLDRLTAALGSPDTLTMVEEIHLLPAPLAHKVMSLIIDSPAWIAVSAAPLDTLDGEVSGLLSCFPHQIELVPVRTYLPQIPAVLRTMLAERKVNRPLSIKARALLGSQRWLGNLREVAAIANHIAARPSPWSRQEITVEELPDGYREPGVRSHLTPLERAEMEVIRSALVTHQGNKVRAAEHLGISRTTLYKSIRRLRIDVPGL